jgi:hypothetical protein
MRKLVGALVVVATLLWSLPSVGLAAELPHKYGLELQLGGGMHLLTDVNDYLPAANFAGITPAEELMVGAQFGIGMLYRQEPAFGWQFGYNRFANLIDQKFRITNAPTFPESWAEQTLSGGELYGLATWYWPWNDMELSFGIGPAIYSATMDRSVDIAQDGGSHITSGSFSDATGKAFGGLGTFGLEIPLKEMVGLNIQVGGRFAKIGKIAYEDPNNAGNDIPVYLNSASGAYLPVDFTGGFVKISLRGYFHPASDWRSPGR